VADQPFYLTPAAARYASQQFTRDNGRQPHREVADLPQNGFPYEGAGQ